MDVARVLSRKSEELKKTDISSQAFQRIANNKIENVKKNFEKRLCKYYRFLS